jgi:uncharacterized membrane protein YphA (DoxX/SURF4 family)
MLIQLFVFVISLYVAYELMLSGEQKLSGNPVLVDAFDLIGAHFNVDSNLFRRLIGLLEIGGSVALVLGTSIAPAALLIVVMLGAIYTHLVIFKDAHGWVPATKLLGLLTLIALLS